MHAQLHGDSACIGPAQHIEATQFCWFAKYDETPLKSKILFSSSAHQGAGEVQVGKIFCIEAGWAAVFEMLDDGHNDAEDAQKYLTVHAEFAPQVRAVDRPTGVGIAQALLSSASPPERVRSLFPEVLRLAETDALPANHKAERHLHASDLWRPPCREMVVDCTMHKTHTAARRVFDLFPATVTGIKNTALFLKGSGVMTHFRNCMEQWLWENLDVQHSRPPASDASTAFRDSVLGLFCPPTAGARAAVHTSLQFFNGDLRSRPPCHYCLGCCSTREDSVKTAVHLMNKLLTVARPVPLSLSNWASWKRTFYFMGLLGNWHSALFAVLPLTMTAVGMPPAQLHHEEDAGADAPDMNEAYGVRDGHRAAARGDLPAMAADVEVAAQQDIPVGQNAHHDLPDAEQEPQQGGWAMEDDNDEMQALRKLESDRRRKTMAFVRRGAAALEELLIIFTVLQPEIRLMGTMMHLSSAAWAASQQAKHIQEGERSYVYKELGRRHGPVDKMIQDTVALLDVGAAAFRQLSSTSGNAIRIWVAVLRAAASVHEVFRSFQSWPFKLFDIVDNPGLAEEIWASPRCRMDKFSEDWVQSCGSLENLRSCARRCTLEAMRLRLVANTFSTERCHAANLRRTKARAHTHIPDVSYLGVWHQGQAGPFFANFIQEEHQKRPATRVAESGSQPDTQQRGDSGPLRRRSVNKRPAGVHHGATAKKVKRTGSGGAWRAFHHMKAASGELRGRRFSGDLQREYWTLPDAERARLATVGANATRARNAGGRAFPALAARQRRRRAGSVSVQPVQVASLSEHVAGAAQGQARAPHAFGEHRRNPLFVDSTVVAPLCLARPLCVEDWMTYFRQVRKHFRSADKKEEDDRQTLPGPMADVLLETSAATMSRVQHLCVCPVGTSVVAVPAFNPTVTFHVDAEQVCSSGHPLGDTLESMASRWKQKHMGIVAHDLPAAPSHKKPCFEAGVCLCRASGDAGPMKKKFYSNFAQIIKQMTPPGSSLREDLASGYLILCLAPSLGEEAVGEHNDPDLTDLYFHVSVHLFKPWRPTLTRIRRQGQNEFRIHQGPEGPCFFLGTTSSISLTFGCRGL